MLVKNKYKVLYTKNALFQKEAGIFVVNKTIY